MRNILGTTVANLSLILQRKGGRLHSGLDEQCMRCV